MTTNPVENTGASSSNNKEKKKTICGACESELEPDHAGIQCIQGHHFCTECSKNIVKLFFSDPHLYIPLRCVQCHVDLNPSVFERQLTADQFDFYDQNMFALVYVKTHIGEDERLDSCPFCNFAVIHNLDYQGFLFCEHQDCGKTSCLVCRKALPPIQSDHINDEQEVEIFKHFTCQELADDKREFDSAVEFGQKVPCPSCGLAGMKDDACTHMTCPTCSQIWCYFCGKRMEDCDKKPGGTNGIYDHNHNWHANPNRCPMYFTQIQDVDERWPGDEEQCLMIFHRIRSLRLLREFVNKLGKDRVAKFEKHFHILNSCGFTMEEILNEDLTLIRGRG
ncbi:unnamed protein product [Adineta ricciae]|uniref:RING-type domain-containing protein n=1 Tax=Adineta ricciae TaxID=249248 RepID=A0A813SLV9_ADIRI|nr:unnamed protein product [Adineta ricciae]CAF0970331.1 unnamed protein product [Adineta ricciae]